MFDNFLEVLTFNHLFFSDWIDSRHSVDRRYYRSTFTTLVIIKRDFLQLMFQSRAQLFWSEQLEDHEIYLILTTHPLMVLFPTTPLNIEHEKKTTSRNELVFGCYEGDYEPCVKVHAQPCAWGG